MSTVLSHPLIYFGGPWGTSENILKVIEPLVASSHPWELLAVRENLVLGNQTHVLKIARHGGQQRIQHGLDTAISLGQANIPVLRPSLEKLVETEIGWMSIWPRRKTFRDKGDVFDSSSAFHLGLALGKMARDFTTPLDSISPMETFFRLRQRLDLPQAQEKFDSSNSISQKIEELANLIEFYLVDDGSYVFSHGDISPDNTVGTGRNLKLIDLDSSSMRHASWDLACINVHLSIEQLQEPVYKAVQKGYSEIRELPSQEYILWFSLAKMLAGTSFFLLLGPQYLPLIQKRLEILEKAVREQRLPEFLPSQP